ncbi:MAG TPA: quinone-dependent dihydroorotate dehydrogenase [Candidatus Tectomicrobia bacterium]|nr:quinone-dependent dihydroorotate dehydrogenase [Candidatus Tectomicrobia bacterium]
MCLPRTRPAPIGLYRLLLQPLFVRIDPERAHHLTLWLLQQLARMPSVQKLWQRWRPLEHGALQSQVAGLHFPNPVGLAAGFDKNAVAVGAFPTLGFGFVEVGTVTPRPQVGNPRPRLFRLPADQALINRLGFNNDGAAAVARRLRTSPHGIPVGINLGKNADTPLEQALDDYCAGLEALFDVGDYLVVNVSSPNTPGLRTLQGRAHLGTLLSGVQAANRALAHVRRVQPRPLFVKIAPDLKPDELDDVVAAVQACALDGIIATNTTLERGELRTPTSEAGGLSGCPLRHRSTAVIRHVYRRAQGRMPIIGVGGIFSADDAYEKICAGASLVQLYTGLIYQGPGLPHRINVGLVRLLQRDGLTHLSQAVGRAAL